MRKLKTTKKKTPEPYWDDSDGAVANAQTLSERYPDQWGQFIIRQLLPMTKSLVELLLKLKGRVLRASVNKMRKKYSDVSFVTNRIGYRAVGHFGGRGASDGKRPQGGRNDQRQD